MQSVLESHATCARVRWNSPQSRIEASGNRTVWILRQKRNANRSRLSDAGAGRVAKPATRLKKFRIGCFFRVAPSDATDRNVTQRGPLKRSHARPFESSRSRPSLDGRSDARGTCLCASVAQSTCSLNESARDAPREQAFLVCVSQEGARGAAAGARGRGRAFHRRLCAALRGSGPPRRGSGPARALARESAQARNRSGSFEARLFSKRRENGLFWKEKALSFEEQRFSF